MYEYIKQSFGVFVEKINQFSISTESTYTWSSETNSTKSSYVRRMMISDRIWHTHAHKHTHTPLTCPSFDTSRHKWYRQETTRYVGEVRLTYCFCSLFFFPYYFCYYYYREIRHHAYTENTETAPACQPASGGMC